MSEARNAQPARKTQGKQSAHKPRKAPLERKARGEQRAQGEQKVQTAQELKRKLSSIHGRGYPAYKDLRGAYAFAGFELSIDHVQGDPFAAPSNLSVRITHDEAGFPEALFDLPHRRRAFEDYLVRRFGKALSQVSFKVPGTGKSGLLATSRPGPEILERTACTVTDAGITMRLEAGFPAQGRTVHAKALEKMLFDLLPRAVESALYFATCPPNAPQAVADLADDQLAIREALAAHDLVCFVADGSILPRRSGISSAPMAGAVPFHAPESLRVTLDLPHRGRVTGMGLPCGITLIVGGGYHGKSTLLGAIEAGVYDHVAGDGRELVITRGEAVKLRAEDGRCVRDVDISPFINNLPNHADTRHFWTDDASGSTSQAASTVEAIGAGSGLFLIDEDTSATNFMVRDALMSQVVGRSEEPITPFVERMRALYEQAGISSIVVAGSSGAFFEVADVVVQMESYEPRDITSRVREVCDAYSQAELDILEPGDTPAPLVLPTGERFIDTQDHPLEFTRKRGGASEGRSGRGEGRDRLKAKTQGRYELSVGDVGTDLRFVEQLVDTEQLRTLAAIVRWCAEKGILASDVRAIGEAVAGAFEREGLAAFASGHTVNCGMARPRMQEIYACLNRLRQMRG